MLFTAEWCTACEGYEDEIRVSLPENVELMVVDVDAEPELTRDLDICAVPALVFSDSNEMLHKKYGHCSSSVISRWLSTVVTP